jgi:hypothetical protein
MSRRVIVVAALVAWGALFGGCTLNPQPFPPGAGNQSGSIPPLLQDGAIGKGPVDGTVGGGPGDDASSSVDSGAVRSQDAPTDANRYDAGDAPEDSEGTRETDGPGDMERLPEAGAE